MIGGQARGIREATSRRSVQKVNRLPWLLVLLTNFSIHRSLPPPFSLPLLFPPLPLLYPSPCPPPLLQLISSRPRRSSTPMFGELLIPTTRDSPLFLVPLSVPPPESARSVLFLLLLHPHGARSFDRPRPSSFPSLLVLGARAELFLRGRRRIFLPVAPHDMCSSTSSS